MRKLAISFKWCSVKKFFSEKAFSKGQMVVFSLLILWGIILNPVLIQFAFFVGGITLGWIFGIMGTKKIREYLYEVGSVIYDPELAEKKKLQEITAAYHKLSYLFGVFWDTQDPKVIEWQNNHICEEEKNNG